MALSALLGLYKNWPHFQEVSFACAESLFNLCEILIPIMDDFFVNYLKEFRQLRKEIRGSKGYLIVGIDVAKEKHNAFFGTATGKTLFKRLIFSNSKEGW